MFRVHICRILEFRHFRILTFGIVAFCTMLWMELSTCSVDSCPLLLIHSCHYLGVRSKVAIDLGLSVLEEINHRFGHQDDHF